MLTVNFWPLKIPLETYLFGFVVAANLLAAWFHSNLAQHVWNLTHPDTAPVFTKDDLATAAATQHGAIGDLWICPICLGTWVSVIVGLVVAICSATALRPITTGEMFQTALQCALTWPLGYYLLHRHMSR
jgi:hypothetical protein